MPSKASVSWQRSCDRQRRQPDTSLRRSSLTSGDDTPASQDHVEAGQPSAVPAAVPLGMPIPLVVPPGMAFPYASQLGAMPTAMPGAVMLVAAQQQSWAGPYPPPEAAERFEKLLPGAFERILVMAEKAQTAQTETARDGQRYLRDDTRRGHWLGFAISVIAMASAIVCVKLQALWVAGAFLSLPVMAVARAFIGGPKPTQAVTQETSAAVVVPPSSEAPQPVEGATRKA